MTCFLYADIWNMSKRGKKYKMAINVDDLSYSQAKNYYLNYLDGKDSTGIGAEVAKSARWKQFITEWNSDDDTTYTDDKAQENVALHSKNSSAWTLTGGIASAGTSAAGLFTGKNNVVDVLNQPKGEKLDATQTGDWGPGSTFHAAMMAVSAAIGLAVGTAGVNTATRARDEQAKAVKQYEADLAYDFEAELARADAEKEAVAAQYEAALDYVEAQEGQAALSDAVSGALSSGNRGLSQIAATRSSQTNAETGEELTKMADEMMVSDEGYIESLGPKFTELQTKSADLNEMGTKFGQIANQNKWGMYLAAAGAALTIAQCFLGMTLSGVQWWNYIIYVGAIAMAGITAVKTFKEGKNQAVAHDSALQFATDATAMGDNASRASTEAAAYSSEYYDYVNEVSEMSQGFGGTGGQLTNDTGLA